MSNLNENFFKQLNYEQPRIVNGMWCALNRYLFTYGVVINMNEIGMSGRFCFDSKLNAELFFKDWDGKSYPVVGEDGCTAIKCNLENIEVKYGRA